MQVKAILLDFDGTLVEEDILSVLAEIVNKREESERINQEFYQGSKPGLRGLIERINLLHGLSLHQIEKKLQEKDYLMRGARELLAFLQAQNIVTILASGTILPVLQYYQKMLGINYVIGTQPLIKNGILLGISEADFLDSDFKLFESQIILKNLAINPEESIAIGDSPGDKSRFLFAGKSIAINPKEGIEEFADYVIDSNLASAIPIIKALREQDSLKYVL